MRQPGTTYLAAVLCKHRRRTGSAVVKAIFLFRGTFFVFYAALPSACNRLSVSRTLFLSGGAYRSFSPGLLFSLTLRSHSARLTVVLLYNSLHFSEGRHKRLHIGITVLLSEYRGVCPAFQRFPFPSAVSALSSAFRSLPLKIPFVSASCCFSFG